MFTFLISAVEKPEVLSCSHSLWYVLNPSTSSSYCEHATLKYILLFLSDKWRWHGDCICNTQTNLVICVIDDIVLQKLCRHLQFDEIASQVSPLLQLGDPLQQPVEDGVDHRFAASHQTLSEGAPAGGGMRRRVSWKYMTTNEEEVLSPLLYIGNWSAMLQHVK